MRWRLGQLSAGDRMQRLALGGVLLGLNLVGLVSEPSWAKWVALVIQVDLIATALMGWCPVLWVCQWKVEGATSASRRRFGRPGG